MDNSMVAWMLAGGRRAELADDHAQVDLVTTRREADASRTAEGRLATRSIAAPWRTAAASVGALLDRRATPAPTSAIDTACCAA